MQPTLTQKTVAFINEHFELLIYLNGALVLCFLTVFVAVKLRDSSFRQFLYTTSRGTLIAVLIGGQIILIALLGRQYWINYHEPAPAIQVMSDPEAMTFWVKDDTRIYFIDDTALRSVKINGHGAEETFRAPYPIREYHFSPDGTYLLIVTGRDLTLLHRPSGKYRRIDSLDRTSRETGGTPSERIQGSIGGVAWSPDNRKFIYEIARWSQYGSQDNVIIYDLVDLSKRSINSPARRISSLYWDREGTALYYLHYEARDPTGDLPAFSVKVFEIPLDTLTPTMVMEFPHDSRSLPIDHLGIRGVELFLGGDKLSFGRGYDSRRAVSETGASVGIDDDDNFYYQGSQWYRRRLFKVPREVNTDLPAQYQYTGGDLVIDHIRWVPDGRYVLMENKYWGVLILEPETGRVGILIQAHGRAFGWYDE